MKLKNQIPKHLYHRGEAAKLGKPDFYVGPTVSKKSAEAPPAYDRDDDLQTRMNETKQAAEAAHTAAGGGSVISLLLHWVKAPFRRTRLRAR